MRKFIFVFVAMLFLISITSGIALTFQNSGDFASYAGCNHGGLGTCTWHENVSCGNSYVTVTTTGATYALLYNVNPNPTTYAAATLISSSGSGHTIYLYDATSTPLTTFNLGVAPSAGRYEVKMCGGAACLYKNGVLQSTSAPITSNPSYVAFGVDGAIGSANWDDYVLGDTETGLLFDVPGEGCYIRKDPIGGGSGLYNRTDTLVSTYNMTAIWSKKSDGGSINIVLQNFGTGVNVDTRSTGVTAVTDTIYYPIADEITGTSQPYGYFVVTTDPGQGVISRTIPYQMGGATALWGQDYYSQSDLANIVTSVGGGYWDTGTYNYQLKVTDLYGNVKQTSTITMQTQSTTYQFSTSDDIGVYIAWLYANKISDGTSYLMYADTTTLTGYVRIEGYVYNSSSQTILSSANVSVTQSNYSQSQFTSATGYYNTSATIPFGTGSMLTVNVTKTGYRQRYIQFIPQNAKTISLTIPMEPMTRSHIGVMLHGLNVDNVYSNPVASPIVIAYNTSVSQNYSVNANPLGDYVFDDSVGTPLTSDVCYHIRSVKNGYTFISPTSPKCVYGV